MSGEPPKANREQKTDSVPPQQTGSAPVRRYVPIAPSGLQEQLGTHAILLPFGASLVGGPQPTASVSGAALPETKKEPGALTGKSVMDNSFVQLTFKCGENDSVALMKRAKKDREAPTGKSVVVLKPCDVIVRNGTVFMPNTIEMAQLKKSEKGQFKTNVQISSKMTEMEIKRILVQTFPYLESKSFYCAGAADNRTRLDFHGAPRLWDGRLIKQKIKGNSALYIFAEGNPVASQKPTTKRPYGQMATPENEAANEALKKLRAFEGVSNDSRSERSLGTAAEMVYEKAFYQTDGRHAETQYDSASPVSHRNPVNQKARIGAGPIPVYCTPVTVPTGNVPIEYPKGQDNSWKILSSETSTKQLPQSVYENQTNMAGDYLKNNNNVQLPACSKTSALTSLSNTSKQFSKVDKQVFNPMCLITHNSNPDCRQETDEGARRLLDAVLLDHKSSVECQSTGTAAEEQSPAVYAEGTNAMERCVTEGHPKDLEISASDSESQLSDFSAHRPTDSGNETSASLTFGDGNLRLQVSIDPERVPYWKGGTVCCFDFEQTLPSHVQSGSAFFGNLGTVKVTRLGNSLVGRRIPARDNPGFEDITLKADSGETLGETIIEYYDDIEETLDTVVNNKILHPLFFAKMAVKAQNDSTNVQNSNSGGSTQSFETLELAVCVAAKCGAMQFIKTVFSSKAGRAICTENPLLPQLLAREHGYEEIANYLEELTTRFLKEAKNVPEESQEIDWQELVTLSKAAIEREELSPAPDERTHPVENDCFDSGYLGDAETSSSEMSPRPSSDSESADSEEDFGVIEPQSTRKKKQGFALGCPKEAALTGAKTLRIEEDQAHSDSFDEMSSTDIHCGERKEEDHDSGMIFGDDTSETADDRRNYWKEDDHSTISKVTFMEQSTAGAIGTALRKTKKEPGALTGKSVIVLKPCDVTINDGTVFIPTTIEMAQLKKSEKGQFRTNVQFSSKMTETDVKRILVETFPFLECQKCYCAGAADHPTRLDFHGERRIWDGHLIKQKIKGNSTLYIYTDESPSFAALQKYEVNCIQDWFDNNPTASSINTHVHQSQKEMDQNQAYGTIQTPQPLDAGQELAVAMAAIQPPGMHANFHDRSVLVLKTSDVKIRGNCVFMPLTIEMSQIKKPEREQFKKVKITKAMTERDVTEKLLEAFPYLRNQRFYCAAAADGRTRLDFNGDRRIWSGRLIKRFLKGNSALYIFVDEQVSGYANTAPQSEASSRTAVATATRNRVDLDAIHSLLIGSSVHRESHFVTQPAQSTFSASSVRDSPKKLPGTSTMLSDKEVYRYTDSCDREHTVPRTLASLDQIRPGDHLCLDRGLYWHHTIVETVDKSNGEVNVINYSNSSKQLSQDNSSPPKNPGFSTVVRRFKLKNESFHVIKHETCFDPEIVVSRAKSKLGEGKYHPLTNNCEHFALWCKTGISSSEQAGSVMDAVKTGVNDVTDTLNTGLLVAVANSSPEQLRTNRPPEQMSTAENELSNQAIKKLRETKGISDNTERNVTEKRTPLRALGTVLVRVSEIASRSYQTEGRLQNLSCEKADMKESAHVPAQFEPLSVTRTWLFKRPKILQWQYCPIFLP